MNSAHSTTTANAARDDALATTSRPAQRLGLGWFSVAIAAVLMLPIAFVATSVFQQDAGAMKHIFSTTLGELIGNSLRLVVLVAVGVAVIGTAAAWLTARYDWRGRKTLEWMLVLPLAMPSYVMAYVYTDLLQYSSPLQSSLRGLFGWSSKSDYWFFEVRSLGGAATMFAFALYPYVYLLARGAFLERSRSLDDAARTFGLRKWQSFYRVSLPLARPAIVAGMALAMMETLADYGTVAYFGVNTFTTGIFNAWFSQGDRVAATKLATMLLGFVAILLFVERSARNRSRYADNTVATAPREPLIGAAARLAALICALPVVAGFVLPVLLLARLAIDEVNTVGVAEQVARLWPMAWNSLTLAFTTATIAVALGLTLAFVNRGAPSGLSRFANRAIGLGYAVPGTVIAVGVLVPVTALDQRLADLVAAMLGREVGLILTGGVSVLIYAYLIRFLAISQQTCEAGYTKITPSMDQAARSLGATNAEVVRLVHLPLLRSSLFTAGLLVFVDVMKELPATLVMRPFNFDTLAVQTYTLAKDERLGEAAWAALAIIMVGLIPIVFASRAITQPLAVRRGL